MASTLCRCATGAALVVLLLPTGVVAQSSSDGDPWNFVVSQRFWFANWDQRLVDIRVLREPTEDSPGLASDGLLHTASRKVVPITSFAVRYGRYIGTLSKFHSTSFSSNGNTVSGVSRRDELDMSFGYQLIPGLTVSYIHKSGNFSATNTVSSSALDAGSEGPSKGRAHLLGLSANAAVSERLSLYGNVAVGPGRLEAADSVGNVVKLKSRYLIGEFGLGFRIGSGWMGGSVDVVTVQAGVRSQSIHVPTGDPIDLGPGFIVVDQQNRGRTTTEGLVLSVSLVF